MKITPALHCLALACLALWMLPAAQAQVAKVNGVAIPQARADLLLKTMTARGQPDSPALKNQIRENLVTSEILVQEARKKALDKNADIATQIELERDSILANAYIADHFKSNPISEETLRKEYDAGKAAAGGREYKVRHIVLKDESEAKTVIAQLKKGGNFEKLAAEKSQDLGSKNKGGDMDWVAPHIFPPQFAAALTKLKKGQVTDAPVQTDMGWHVIRLDDERALKFPTFEEAKPSILQQLQGQAVQKLTADLRSKAKVE